MKRQVALLLCGMLVISALAGCGDKQDDAGSDSRTKVESSQENSAGKRNGGTAYEENKKGNESASSKLADDGRV